MGRILNDLNRVYISAVQIHIWIRTMKTLATHHISPLDQQTELRVLTGRLLRLIGEDPARSGLLNTPERFAKAFTFLTSGRSTTVDEIVGDALFDEPAGDLVFVRDIEFFSLCEHHILPFFGKAHVAYIPNGKVIGLSKIPRIVNMYARRLQVQERLTQEIARVIEDILQPKGVAVITEASHLCMMMRGVEKQNSTTIAKSTLGEFATDAGLRAELTALLKK
jgi:GTP cyclohydrolase I